MEGKKLTMKEKVAKSKRWIGPKLLGMIQRKPVEVERAYLYNLDQWKYWRDFPHKRYEWVRTDDNWLCCVTWIFDDGSVSLAGKWILTPKKAKQKEGYRLFRDHTTRIRFNNRVKILVNTALLLGDWEKAYLLTYNRPANSIKDILRELNKGGEDYLMQEIDALLKEHGITREYVLSTFKDMADGLKIVDGEKKEDRGVRDTTRLQILQLFSKWMGIDQVTPKIEYHDNRKVELDIGQALKQLQGKNEEVSVELSNEVVDYIKEQNNGDGKDAETNNTSK